METQICAKCGAVNLPENFFCFKCGKKLKEPPVSTSIGKQILIYSVSFLLPPFGLGWAFSYMKQGDTKAKIIGAIALALTIISLVGTIWITLGIFDTYSRILNNVSSGNVKDLPSGSADYLQQLKSLSQ